MNDYICCHHTLLRHVHRGNLYWFCPQCRQAMPSAEMANAEINITAHFFREQKKELLQTLEPVPL